MRRIFRLRSGKVLWLAQYAIIMIVNGMGHNLGTLVTKKYFDGFVGGFTGIRLAIVGVPLLHYLRRESRSGEEAA